MIRDHHFIIFCGHGPNALGIIRSLHEAGVEPIMIINKNGPHNYADKSRFVGVRHYTESSQEALDLMIEKYGDEPNKPFVYTTDDYHAQLLDENYERLEGRFFFFNCGGKGKLTELLNKDVQCQIAEKCGFLVPVREVVKRGALPNSLCYPIITKTITSNEGGWKNDVFICNNEEELKVAYDNISADTLLLEEYIRKKSEISLHGISIDFGEIVCVPLFSEDNSFSAKSFGHRLLFKPLNDETVIAHTMRFVQSIRFSGVFCIDLIQDEEGRLVFLEINMRSGARNYAITSGGFNMPINWASATLKKEMPEFALKNESFFFMDEVSEIDSVFKDRAFRKKWLKDLKNADVFMWYYRRDVKPLRCFLAHKLKNGLRKLYRLRKSV